MKRIPVLLVCGAAACGMVAVAATPGRVSLADVPSAALAAASTAVPGLAVEAAEIESAGTRAVYEIEGEAGGVAYEVLVTSEGELLEVAREATLAEVPAAVRSAAEAAIEGVSLTEAEEVRIGDATVWEVEGVVGGTEHEIRVTPEGVVVGAVQEDEDEPGDGEIP